MALLATWALVASVGFGWMWTTEQQDQASIRTTVDRIVFQMGSEFLKASAATQSLLLRRSLLDGANASAWLDAVQDQVDALFYTTEGMTVVQALNLTGEVTQCSVQAYVTVLALAASNASLLAGTNPYTLYFAAAESLTGSLGHHLWNITGSSSGAPVQLGSPSATAIRAELAALYAASASYGGAACPY